MVVKCENDDFTCFDWRQIRVDPETPETSFCVVHKQNDRSPMLEKISSELVKSTESLAYEEQNLILKKHDFFRMYFSVIITTAELIVCSFDPKDVSISNGKIADAEYKVVPYLRFKKQLSTVRAIPDTVTFGEYEEIVKAKENTVFVINSNYLIDFLSSFQVTYLVLDD